MHRNTSEGLWSSTQASLNDEIEPGLFQRRTREGVIDTAESDTGFIGSTLCPGAKRRSSTTVLNPLASNHSDTTR